MSDYLDRYGQNIKGEAIRAARRRPQSQFFESWRARELPNVVPHFAIVDGVVEAGQAGNENEFRAHLEFLKPWRKGPFRVGGLDVDAEWRSDLKWNRIAPALPPLKGLRVADVGCGNGYYLFRLSESDPELVVGFDPTDRYAAAFELVQHAAQRKDVFFERFGFQELSAYPGFFDLSLCMGVIYHQRDPQEVLRAVHASLKSGGTAIIESITVASWPGGVLRPGERYAQMRNVFDIPTPETLCDWMRDAGFLEVEVFSTAATTPAEQRVTKWSSERSLADFLDPNDFSKTIEGYPAPVRTAVRARKG